MKILIIRPWPSLLDVTKNTYNIQEVGLAKALVKRGHSTDILFWTDGDEMTVEVEAEGGKSIRVFYRHGKVLLKNVWFSGQDALFAPSSWKSVKTFMKKQVNTSLQAKLQAAIL